MKRTGGGTFDQAERPVYFAAAPDGRADIRVPPYVLVAVNELPTADTERDRLRWHLDAGRKVLLDSGIFWLTNEHKRKHGCSMDEALALAPEDIDGFEQLYARYTELVGRWGDRLWGYIELDQGGAANKRRTRARLEAEGCAPMPVYHPLNDGWDYFDELASTYDRICFGNIVQAPRPVRLRLLHTMWERHRAYPDLWIHMLGLTPSDWCLAFPPDSCDSSTWLAPLRWSNHPTESALLHRLQVFGPGFLYDLDDSPSMDRGRPAAISMCSDTVTATQMVWQHAATRTAEVLGQDPHPPYLPGERTEPR